MKTNVGRLVVRPNEVNRDGFTLTELVVVLGAMAALILLAAPVLANSKSQTKIGVCASHVRQIALACQIYANDNNNRLPIGDIAWAWDLAANSADALLNYGMKTNLFYCPGTAPSYSDIENWMAPYPNSLWTFPGPSFHVIGYALAFSGPGISPTNRNTTMLPETIQNGSTVLPAPAASERVLVADATLSTGATLPGYTHPENNFTRIPGGFNKYHLSAHLKGNIPSGGNIGFKDGHVAWRRFEVMATRQGNSSPYFWW